MLTLVSVDLGLWGSHEAPDGPGSTDDHLGPKGSLPLVDSDHSSPYPILLPSNNLPESIYPTLLCVLGKDRGLKWKSFE